MRDGCGRGVSHPVGIISDLGQDTDLGDLCIMYEGPFFTPLDLEGDGNMCPFLGVYRVSYPAGKSTYRVLYYIEGNGGII